MAFNVESNVLTSGFGYRLRLDFLKRYTYPTHLHDKKVAVDGMRVVHPNIGIIVLKGPQGERVFASDMAQRLKQIWNCSATDHVVQLADVCYACNREHGDNGEPLRTCSFCLLTSHAYCIEHSGFSDSFKEEAPSELPERFNFRNMCS